MNSSKICVVGLGGVGGCIGAMLAHHQDHVAFFVRGKRREAILDRGLKLYSAAYGELTAFPEKASNRAEELGTMDYIFLCVKNFSLEEVCREIAPMVGETTVIVPLLNGIDVSDRIRGCLSRGVVLDSLVYVVTGTDQDFAVHHTSPYCNVHIGFGKNIPGDRQILSDVQKLLQGAQINCSIESDIEAAIWKKYILNCAYNVVTAYYNATTEELKANPAALEQLKALLAEACLVARQLGVNIAPDLEAVHMDHILHEQSGSSTSSLKRDMEAGQKNELDVFSGKLLDLASRCGVSIPMTEYFYRELQQKSSLPRS